MYKVTNKMKDVRKFRDRMSGKDILVNPGDSVHRIKPPEESEVWKVEKIEKLPEKKIIKKEVDK